MKHIPFFTDNARPTHAKISIYGAAGTGKTYLACRLAIGLCKEQNLRPTIAFFDTEDGSDWVLPLFEQEGIKCHVKKSRTFADLLTATQVATQKATLLIIDSITHVWRELAQSYLRQYNADRFEQLKQKYGAVWARNHFRPALQLEPQHWAHLKSVWAQFTDLYLTSHLHIIVCGREADLYRYEETPNGQRQPVCAGTRIASEKELSYEPSLLIQMTRRGADDRLVALVEKDRSGTLKHTRISNPQYRHFRPYFDSLATRSKANLDLYHNTSATLFAGRTLEPDDEFALERRLRTQLSEEIKGLLDLRVPGQTAQARQERLELLYDTLHTLSWTKVENTPSATLEKALHQLSDKLRPEVRGE